MTRWWPWSRDALESTRHALIVCGTVLCFVPVLAYEIRPDVWTDDVMLNQPQLRNLLLTSQDFNNVCIACAVIATPSLADAFMDLFVWWRHSGKGGEGELSTKMAHMSISERVLFCTGMLLALIPRAPGLLHSHRIEQWYDDGRHRLPSLRKIEILSSLHRYYAFNGANGLMCMAPIILFLGRVNKKVWAGYKVVVMNWLIAVASILQSAMALYAESTPAHDIMHDISMIFMALALGFYVLNVMVMTVRQQMKWRRRQRRRAASMMADIATETNTTDDLDETEKAVNHDVFVAHSFNQLLLLVVNVVWFGLTPTDVGITTVFCIYIAVAGCVLLVEMRVRKSEIQHGLAQLNSKRAFVRYCRRALLLLPASSLTTFDLECGAFSLTGTSRTRCARPCPRPRWACRCCKTTCWTTTGPAPASWTSTAMSCAWCKRRSKRPKPSARTFCRYCTHHRIAWTRVSLGIR
jgi:uncharacterized membrane protein